LDGVGFLTILGVGVGFCCPIPTPQVKLDNFYITFFELGIPIEMVQFLMKLLLKQRILAVYHDFHYVLVATKFLTVKFHSGYVKESEIVERSESDI